MPQKWSLSNSPLQADHSVWLFSIYFALTVPFISLAFSFSSFWRAYFSLWRSRHLKHFVASPLSPNAAHGLKFLQPLHHLICRPDSFTTHTLTSQYVQRPLFWAGIIARWLTCSDLPWNDLALFLLVLGLDRLRDCPHMTQHFMPSGSMFCLAVDDGKLTRVQNSGTTE